MESLTIYLEPVATLDVDIFVSFQPLPGQLIITPQPLFDYLKAQGHRIEGEYVVISDWPVQFLLPANPLMEEALAQAVEMVVDGTPTLVFSALSRSRQDGPKTKRDCYSSLKLAL